ncbi:serine protease easter-like isoform X2 [Photinus pyralis]|nr:serine protease easter-like isoform X2 [Photinus pyralis]
MVEYLQSAPALTSQVIQILNEYQCGFERNEVKVCCPDGAIQINKPKNPTGHRNLNLLPQNCGLLPGGNRIIGGNKTALFEFPWMALLTYDTPNGRDFRCGGSIINSRYILTAAHCITKLSNLKLVQVRCGEYNISSSLDCEIQNEPQAETLCAPPVQDMDFEETIPHPDYNPATYTDDIGLIRLAAPLNLSVESVKPICLPVDNSLRNFNFTSRRLIVTGWGATEAGRRSEDLLKVEVGVTSLENCRRIYANTPALLNEKQICAGGHKKRDSCGGDSGGPLQRIDTLYDDSRFVQYGIVSFGPRLCGQEGFPGVYTRTDSYMEWILDNLRP